MAVVLANQQTLHFQCTKPLPLVSSQTLDVCSSTSITLPPLCCAGSFATCIPPDGSVGTELLPTESHRAPVPQKLRPRILKPRHHAFNCFAILNSSLDRVCPGSLRTALNCSVNWKWLKPWKAAVEVEGALLGSICRECWKSLA